MSLRRTRLAFAGLLVALLAAACGSSSGFPVAEPTTTVGPPSPAVVQRLLPHGVEPPLLLTYFFYWYDVQTQSHLRPQDGLPVHLPPIPPATWRSDTWFATQLRDMTAAGINVALPVYWGDRPDEPWSAGGLPHLVAARDQLAATGQKPPTIGMFYDTSTVRGVDLTTQTGIAAFYANIASFFRAVPERDWALVAGRPIVWLFLPQDNRFDQRVFNAVYARFARDFGVRPYIVRATGWDCPNTTSGCAHPIRTDASYVWGTAQDGVQLTRLVASAGPGYDERRIAGRRGTHVSRGGGAYYRKNFTAAVQSGRPFVAIETWNEIHEASAIAETVEYGRKYIDLTRSIVDAHRGSP
jgi:hypothetical protein